MGDDALKWMSSPSRSWRARPTSGGSRLASGRQSDFTGANWRKGMNVGDDTVGAGRNLPALRQYTQNTNALTKSQLVKGIKASDGLAISKLPTKALENMSRNKLVEAYRSVLSQVEGKYMSGFAALPTFSEDGRIAASEQIQDLVKRRLQE